MGKSADNMSTYELQMSLQFIESISTELVQFKDMLDKRVEAGEIDSTYRDITEKRIWTEVQKNNELLEEIEGVISKRIRSNFPGIISQNQLKKMSLEFQAELDKHKNKPVAKGKVVKTDFTVSKEKKHDSK